MINEKDVVRMKVSFPSISSDLAVQAHMYICASSSDPNFGFVKCQTLKPYMVGNNPIHHYVDEAPDITRNPFSRTSRIDCDKLFCSSSVRYDNSMKTTARPDVCDDLFAKVKSELCADGYRNIQMNENELCSLNFLITKI